MSEPVTGGPPLEALFSAAYDGLLRLASLVRSDDARASLVTLYEAANRPAQAAQYRAAP